MPGIVLASTELSQWTKSRLSQTFYYSRERASDWASTCIRITSFVTHSKKRNSQGNLRGRGWRKRERYLRYRNLEGSRQRHRWKKGERFGALQEELAAGETAEAQMPWAERVLGSSGEWTVTWGTRGAEKRGWERRPESHRLTLSALRSQSQSGLAISRGEQGDSKRWGRGASHELRIPFAGLAAPGNVGVLPLLNLKSRVLSVCKDSNPTMECCRFKQECGEEATEGPWCF